MEGFTDLREMPIDLCVGESKHGIATGFERSCARLVRALPFRHEVLRAVQLYDEARLGAEEIHDEGQRICCLYTLTGYERRKQYHSLRSQGVMALRRARALASMTSFGGMSGMAVNTFLFGVPPLRPSGTSPP